MRSSCVGSELHLCPSCKIKMVSGDYERCYGCQAKWWKVYDECIGAGWPEDLARSRADDSYHPLRRG